MKKTALKLASLASVFALSGCGTTNSYLAEKTTQVEYYRIFDIKTSASRTAVAKAASAGLGRNVNNAQEATPIPTSSELPEVPGRFKLVNPLEGSKFAAFAGAGMGMRIAACEGAVWTAKAQRKVAGSNNLNVTACLFQYKGGYHLNFYGMFTKSEGGLFQVSRDMASAMVGTPEQWTEKTFLDVVRSIRKQAAAEVTLLEAQPDIEGTPWLDSVDAQ